MGFFNKKYKCPITPEDRAWVEENFCWLIEQFGLEVLSWRQFTPTIRAFPHYQANSEQHDPDDYLDVICKRMGIEPTDIQLELYLDDPNAQLDTHIYVKGEGDSAAGLYWGRYHTHGKFLIQLNLTTLNNVERMVATLAHELSHVLLLGEFRISEDREDHEFLTDLTAIFWGFGIFSGNSRFFHEAWSNSEGSGWRMQTLGYLPLEMMAYATALQCYLAGAETKNTEGFMEKGFRNAFKKSIGFLGQNESELPEFLIQAKKKVAAGFYE